jgi:hypothetical protein
MIPPAVLTWGGEASERFVWSTRSDPRPPNMAFKQNATIEVTTEKLQTMRF